MGFLEQIDKKRLPKHVGIIMDGNGRWAKRKLLARVKGHESGVRAVRDTVEAARELGLQALSLYAFSTENWSRPRHEVEALMRLLKKYLVEERPTIMDNNIRLVMSGDIARLPGFVREELEKLMADSGGNDGMFLNLCLSYGGQREIVVACQQVCERVRAGEMDPEDVSESDIAKALWVPELPPMDLMIRTSNELRISNFMLWQLAYAELIFLEIMWPDFTKESLYESICEFQRRERRFGNLP